mgnify:CR=1 FL=1|jgi:hypothetical protein
MTVVFAGHHGAETLKALLFDCHGEYVIAENYNGIMIKRFTPDLIEELAAGWQKGWVFAQDFEVRWEKEDNCWHLRYIGPEREMDDSWQSFTGIEKAKESRSLLYLWGTRDAENEWVEQRIPRILSYPVAGEKSKNHIALEQVEYRDRETNELLLTRFAGIREVD